MSLFRTLLVSLGSVTAGAVLGPLVALGAFLATGPTPDERAEALLLHQEATWLDPLAREESIAGLRAQNPEWDFMRRTFLVLAAADRALANPEETDRWLALIDDVLADTLAAEAENGHAHFLLPYARFRPWKNSTGRSLFVDGEIGLMIGARRMVRDDRPELRAALAERVARIEQAFAEAPAGLPESYPDEAWMFCVTNGLVALRMADQLDGADHRATIEAWTRLARERMVHEPSGLLGSEYRSDGTMLDGPEGSSLWLVVTNLSVLDPPFAATQYESAVDALSHQVLGYAWANEWGPHWRGPEDIDSGPIVPVLGASASSSGFALVASAAFGDGRLHRRLARSLRAADLLILLDEDLAAAAANPMGDVIVAYAMGFGPLWDQLRRDEPRGLAQTEGLME